MSSNINPEQVDVRGPRFVAWVTTAVLTATLILAGISPAAAGVLLALEALVFAIGPWLGPRNHPYGRVFAALVAPRLGWFVLRELLGHQNVKNYDGSWTAYGSLVGAPIELGS